MSTANNVENAKQAKQATEAKGLLEILFDRWQASGVDVVDYVKTLDIDQTGDVSPTELGIVLLNKGIKSSVATIKVLFQKLDRNGSGKIVGEEFNQGLVQILNERAGTGFLFGRSLQPEKAVYGEQFLLQKLERVQNEMSHFFRDFTKPELRLLMQFSEGTIQYKPGEIIVPAGEHGHWVGLLFEGKYVDIMEEGDPEPHAHYTVGHFIRQFEFIDAYFHHDHTFGAPKKPPKQPKVAHGATRRGVGGHKADHAGSMDKEYVIGSKNDGGAILVWSIRNIRELAENGHNDLAMKFVRKTGISMVSDVKERLHHGHLALEDYKAGNIVPEGFERIRTGAAEVVDNSEEVAKRLNADWEARMKALEDQHALDLEELRRKMNEDYEARLQRELEAQQRELQAEFDRQLATAKMVAHVREELIRGQTTNDGFRARIEDTTAEALGHLRTLASHVATEHEGVVEKVFEPLKLVDKRGNVKNGSINQKNMKALMKGAGIDPLLKNKASLENLVSASTGQEKPNAQAMRTEIMKMMQAQTLAPLMKKIEQFSTSWQSLSKQQSMNSNTLAAALEAAVDGWGAEDAKAVSNGLLTFLGRAWDDDPNEPLEFGEVIEALHQLLVYSGHKPEDGHRLVTARGLLMDMRASLKMGNTYALTQCQNAMENWNHETSTPLFESTSVRNFLTAFDVGNFDVKPPTPEPEPEKEEEEEEEVVEPTIVVEEKIITRENRGKLLWGKVRQWHMQRSINKKNLAMALRAGHASSLADKRKFERDRANQLEKLLRLAEAKNGAAEDELRQLRAEVNQLKAKMSAERDIMERLKKKNSDMVVLLTEHERRIEDLEDQLKQALKNLRLAHEARRNLEAANVLLEKQGKEKELIIARQKSSYKALHAFLGFQLLSMSTFIIKLQKELRFTKGQANRATRHVENLQAKLKSMEEKHGTELADLRAQLEAERQRAKRVKETLSQTEDAAKYAVQQILQRLRVSEMRTGELEKRFSSMSRPSTALLDAVSHLDLGFMRQPLPGMEQLDLLDEEKDKSIGSPRPPYAATGREPHPPDKRERSQVRMQTYPKGSRKTMIPPIQNVRKIKRIAPAGAWKTRNMRDVSDEMAGPPPFQSTTKLRSARSTKKLKKPFGSTNMYDYGFQGDQ
jgi:hypothetical protein